MFRRKHLLYDDNPDSAGGGAGGDSVDTTSSATTANPATTPAEIDIAAIEAAAYKKAEEKFKKDFEAKQEKVKKDSEKQRLHEQGEFKTLLEQSQAEIALLKAEKAKAIIKNEIMRNSGDIAEQHKSLLVKVFEGDAVYEDGEVKIDGLQASVYIAKFLKENNSYKKPTANLGSGAPGSAETPVKNPFSKENFNLTEQLALLKNNPTLAAQLKAAAK
jgi:hypothetical protein